MAEFSRRRFVQALAASAALAQGWTPAESRGASEPGAAGQPSFRYAMCNETFAGWEQGKIFQYLAECGYGGVELAPFTIHKDVREISAERRAELRHAARQAGIEVIGLHWLLSQTHGFHLTSPDAVVRQATAAYLGELARFCRDLGGHIMVFGSPKQRNLAAGTTYQEGLRHAAQTFRDAMPVLADCKVTLAIEPLSPRTTNFLNTAAEAVELIGMVDSPFCRLQLDCLAMSSEATPIPDLIRRHAAQLVHFHANDPNSLGPGMGSLDFTPILQALREIRYQDWVSVEVFDTSPGPERVATQSLAYLRKIQRQLANPTPRG
jgi:sugar phosphate isomerase/epimerase